MPAGSTPAPQPWPLPSSVQAPTWIEEPRKQRRSFDVVVKSVPPSNVESTARYTGLFTSSFEAYDDALLRFPHAARIEVRAREPRTAAGAA